MLRKFWLLLIVIGFTFWALPGRAQNLFVDGDFSVNPGTGTALPADPSTITNQGSGSYQYDSNTGVVTGVGGTGGWTFVSGSFYSGTTQEGSGIYLDNTAANPNSWVPAASAGNTNGYVVQLDTVNTPGSWTAGNGIQQSLATVSGQTYQISFSINTEAGDGKEGTSAIDLMITNGTIVNNGGAASTVLTTSATNLNAKSYGDVTGYQYTVTTTGTGGSSTTWQTYTMTFTADSTSSEVSFADDPLSDNSNISLELISAVAVPEPREYALVMLLVVAALILPRMVRRYRLGVA